MRDYWVFNFTSQAWLHVATLWRADNPSSGQPETDLGEVYTFVEDWAATSEWFRSCYIFNARKRYQDGDWHVYNRAQYSINDRENNPATSDGHDPNTQAEIREEHKIWLATGGTYMPENRTRSGSLLRFTPNESFQPQQPQFSDVKAEPVDDSTMIVSWDFQESLWAAQESYSLKIFQDADNQNLLYSTGTLYPFNYESVAREADSDRKALMSGLHLENDKVYYLQLETATIFGFTCSKTLPLVNLTAEVKQGESKMPSSLELKPAYPNPFNAEVAIRYELRTTEHVALDIYDVRGAKIRKLVNGVRHAGEHEIQWDAKNDQGIAVASGLYVVRLNTGGMTLSDKITLLK
jgi:hypothetical protein